MPKHLEAIDTSLPPVDVSDPHDSSDSLPLVSGADSRKHSFAQARLDSPEVVGAEPLTPIQIMQSLITQSRLSTPIGFSHPAITRTTSGYFTSLSSPSTNRVMWQSSHICATPLPKYSSFTQVLTNQAEETEEANPVSIISGSSRGLRRVVTWDTRRLSKELRAPAVLPSISPRSSCTGRSSPETESDSISYGIESRQPI